MNDDYDEWRPFHGEFGHGGFLGHGFGLSSFGFGFIPFGFGEFGDFDVFDDWD
jgi:hypothetical protein